MGSCLNKKYDGFPGRCALNRSARHNIGHSTGAENRFWKFSAWETCNTTIQCCRNFVRNWNLIHFKLYYYHSKTLSCFYRNLANFAPSGKSSIFISQIFWTETWTEFSFSYLYHLQSFAETKADVIPKGYFPFRI